MSSESQRFCELGAQHLERDEPEEALEWYRRAIAEDYGDPDAWAGRGKACYRLGRLERAHRCFKKAQRCIEPALRGRAPRRGWWADEPARQYLRLLHWRALCLFWLGAYERAARLFRKILKLAPSDPLEARFLLGETYFRMGDLERAVREFEQAGDDPDAVYNLGLARFYQGDFARSVNAFRRGIFENMFLAARLAELDLPVHVPSHRGTHPKQLDSSEAADEYVDRCGDLWFGRPLLRNWLRAIIMHPVVHRDVERHLEQVSDLATKEHELGEAARLEGANAALRDEARLARTDAAVATDVMKQVFKLPEDGPPAADPSTS